MCASSASNASSHRHRHEEGDLVTDPAAAPPARDRTTVPVFTHCGVLAGTRSAEDVHDPPATVHARNAEGRYWKDFSTQVQNVFSENASDEARVIQEVSWNIQGVDALSAAERQQNFFKSVDQFHADPEDLLPTGAKRTDPIDLKKATAIKKMPPSYAASDAVVMESAYFLIKEGMLNNPDTGTVNVKQARAFLWNAAWLQEYMSSRWREEGLLQGQGQDRKFQQFALAIIGPGGTGKTAVLKVTEALTVFFAGPDTVRKLAPSDAAARLFGSDTLHSLCELPFGKSRLTSKQGRLTKDTLRRHWKKWETAVAAYMDEVSMISSDQFLQCDVRMRQAKMRSESPLGGLA